MTRTLIAAGLLALAAAGAQADVRTAHGFHYEGGMPDDVRVGNVFSAWNAHQARNGLSPGVKVMFFGRADACDVDAVNGPTVPDRNPRLQQSLELTGIDYDGLNGKTWSPSGDFDRCSPAARGRAGDSFIHVNPDPKKGGVAMFTYTGRDATTGRTPFFHPFEATGQVGSGANGFISGSFFAFRFAANDKRHIDPWGGAPAGREPVLVFSSRQSVVRAEVPGSRGTAAADGTQAKQQMIFTLINRSCFKTLSGNGGKLCQIQYLLNLAIYRTGVDDWSRVDWFRDAGVLFDPAQGGVPIVHGPLPARGVSAFDARSGLPLYTSEGEPTQHGEFRDKRFAIRVSFTHLKNALRAAVAGRTKGTSAQVSPAQVAAEFGPRWDDPEEWSLLSVNIGQEVYNRSRERRAFIAGNFRDLAIGPP